MELNLSNAQIAQELGLDPSATQRMTEQLRDGVVIRQPEPVLSGEVECDEVYVIAGHQGQPEAVRSAGRRGRRRRLKGARGPYKCRFFHASPSSIGNDKVSEGMGRAGQGSGQPWPIGNG